MRYHPDDFVALSVAVDEEGGDLLADPCVGSVYDLKIKRGKKDVWERFRTTHCNYSALMDIPYDPTFHIRLHDEEDDTILLVDHEGEKPYEEMVKRPLSAPKMMPVQAKVRVCAVDDAVGLWPRYNGIVSDRSTQE